eukprot:TRINITY_DN2446_c0_g1_i15.p4 TRINITY_DN2446_c0_g1~~TRINITY_DN2446_c0_g1_i15.p4  ORF type:complete len:168 (+),score=51.26 TRINITY_DN2446_c0_g1_i15:1179-1682(+)
MERVMYHYEAVLRIALRDQRVALRKLYGGSELGVKPVAVGAVLAPEADQVRFVEKLSEPEVLGLLQDGYIVVSENRTELGIEYLSPYQTDDGELLVAAVQCKFVEKSINWTEINEKLERAMGPLKSKGVQAFPVVYTTVQRESMREASRLADGPYFTWKGCCGCTRR